MDEFYLINPKPQYGVFRYKNYVDYIVRYLKNGTTVAKLVTENVNWNRVFKDFNPQYLILLSGKEKIFRLLPEVELNKKILNYILEYNKKEVSDIGIEDILLELNMEKEEFLYALKYLHFSSN